MGQAIKKFSWNRNDIVISTKVSNSQTWRNALAAEYATGKAWSEAATRASADGLFSLN
jgi:diketogulonate reductase-like aldo/keto reductase